MDYGTNSKDIIGKKVRFIVEEESDIPDRGNVGDVCFVADTSKFYIAGMTGWFGYGFEDYIEFPTEEGGTVIFDGAVTLTEGEEGLSGTVSIDTAMEVGYYYSIILNGQSISGLATYDDDGVEVSIFNEDTHSGLTLLYNAESGTATVMCSADIGTVGENTLVIRKISAPSIDGTVYYEGHINAPDGGGFVSLDGADGLSPSAIYYIQANGRTVAGVPRISGQMLVAQIPVSESDGTILRCMNREGSDPNVEIALAQMFGVGDVYVKIIEQIYSEDGTAPAV